MLPNPARGCDAAHVFPPSSVIAISPAEYVSEYSGSRTRPEARMTGQNSHSLPPLSTNIVVLQSGKPGVSAIRNASPHLSEPALRRAPYTATSSADRSPLPRYHDTRRSPLGHSTTPGAWLCCG